MVSTEESLDHYWNMLTNISHIQNQTLSFGEIKNAFHQLSMNNMIPLYENWYIFRIRDHLIFSVIPNFWSKLCEADSDKNSLRIFPSICYLREEYHRILKNHLTRGLFYNKSVEMEKFQDNIKFLIKYLLVSSTEPHFSDYILDTYSFGFKVFRKMVEDKIESNAMNDKIEENECIICTQKESTENKECKCQITMQTFIEMNSYLRDMDLLDIISSDAISSVIHSHIDNYVFQKCHQSFEISFLEKLKDWVKTTVLEWRKMIFDNTSDFGKVSDERLMHFMYETYSELRIKQMFDMIIEFPDSEPAIEDLKECLQKCHGSRAKVIASIKNSFKTRLLHPGVGTHDVITAYIQTIKSLKVLDPSGVILQLVCDPIKAYLKNREDTVRCIITALTDESSELVPELAKNPPQMHDEYFINDEYNNKSWRCWKPDSIDALNVTHSSKSVRFFDIVSILVNVYESKDLFVEEYQRLLAQRFLQNFDCNVDHERRNLELLTLRFGESDFHCCEVMLQDISSSKRIDNRINIGEIAAYHFTNFPIKCLILSAQFWPDKLGLTTGDEANKIKIPPCVREAIDTYTKAFETIKGSRTLNWLHQFGLVEIDLEFGNTVLSFNVSPIHATIIYQFQEQTSWTLSDLSQAIAVPSNTLRKKMTYWQNKGIIKEVDNKFILVEDQSLEGQNGNNRMNVVEEFDEYYEDSIESTISIINNEKQAIEEKKLKVYWTFIENMLTNLNSLPLERIHSMLQMFAMQGSNEEQLTIQQLKHFLDVKLKEQKLAYSMGQYKLVSNL